MNIIEFDKGITKLEDLYYKLSDEKRNIYFDHLRLLSEELFYKAIDYVIDTHQGDYFPKPSEILGATTRIDNVSLANDRPQPGCEKCDYMGYILTEHATGQPTAKPCGCELGQKISKGWQQLHGDVE